MAGFHFLGAVLLATPPVVRLLRQLTRPLVVRRLPTLSLAPFLRSKGLGHLIQVLVAAVGFVWLLTGQGPPG
jgi:hypothetical protein